jgi:hypothetical protein
MLVLKQRSSDRFKGSGCQPQQCRGEQWRGKRVCIGCLSLLGILRLYDIQTAAAVIDRGSMQIMQQSKVVTPGYHDRDTCLAVSQWV